MSRIGKKPVEFAADIKVSSNGNVITFAKGKNSVDLDTKGYVTFEVEGNTLTFKNLSDSLAGRIGIIDLYAFNLSEIYQKNYNVIDYLFSNEPVFSPSTFPDVMPEAKCILAALITLWTGACRQV